MESVATKVNGQKPLTAVAKISIFDAWGGSCYGSGATTQDFISIDKGKDIGSMIFVLLQTNLYQRLSPGPSLEKELLCE